MADITAEKKITRRNRQEKKREINEM